MPRWQSESQEFRPSILIPATLFLLTIYFLLATIEAFDVARFSSIFNFVLSISLLVYFAGRLYGEFTINKDYIEVTSEGIRFRETPGVSFGWIPKNVFLSFDSIERVDLIEIKFFFQPERKFPALLIISKAGKEFILGSKLSREQQVNVLIALRGSVTFSSAIHKLLEISPEMGDTLKSAVNLAKGIWKNYKGERN
ncbi:MAG: hypothetical protein INQ03_02980 [Candidatus Heimdallarchaeota archaeon]|nr:hypothetical protein [Candidatus Heimdallarchaeota archaeon]